MPIKIFITNITKEEILSIIEYYNSTKHSYEPNLKFLPCKEGGFKLDIGIDEYIKKYKKYGYYSITIKQIRFYQNILVSYYNYPGFSKSEEWRLYLAISNTIGRENVKWYESFSGALNSNQDVTPSSTNIKNYIYRSSSTNSLDEIWRPARIRI